MAAEYLHPVFGLPCRRPVASPAERLWGPCKGKLADTIWDAHGFSYLRESFGPLPPVARDILAFGEAFVRVPKSSAVGPSESPNRAYEVVSGGPARMFPGLRYG